MNLVVEGMLLYFAVNGDEYQVIRTNVSGCNGKSIVIMSTDTDKDQVVDRISPDAIGTAYLENCKWPPLEGQDVYIMTAHGICVTVPYDSSFVAGSYYQTREIARNAMQSEIVKQELAEFANKLNRGWTPDYSTDDFKYAIVRNYVTDTPYQIMCSRYVQHANSIVFASKSGAEEAITHFGDRLSLIFDGNAK